MRSNSVSHWLIHHATSSAVADKYLNEFTLHDEGYFSRRSGTLIVVVSLHAVLFYGLLTTLSHIHASASPEPLQNRPVDNPRARDPMPALAPPQLNNLKIEAQIPEINVPAEIDTGRELATTTDRTAPKTAQPPTRAHVAT